MKELFLVCVCILTLKEAVQNSRVLDSVLIRFRAIIRFESANFCWFCLIGGSGCSGKRTRFDFLFFAFRVSKLVALICDFEIWQTLHF